jgi:benzodiazapine receptor
MSTATNKRGFQLWPLVISLVITLSIAGVASYFTVPQIPVWYAYLQKPSFNPPNWLFGPVWTTLYVMIAIAAYLVWKKRSQSIEYANAKYVYILQLLLNFSWSIIFFGMHQILAALIVIGLLWLTIIVNILFFSRINKAAAWLLVPYLLWVSFASLLNFSIYKLN